MYPQVEIGEDIPRKRPRRLVAGIVIAIVAGVLAGMAVMLQVRGWGTLISEAGGSCGSSHGISHGACPRGMAGALLISFLIGIPAVPAALVVLFRRRWITRVLVVIAAAGGVLAGQSVWGALHGQELAVAWTASYDTSFELTTVGAWTHGDSLVRVRVDGATAYDGATGRQLWSVILPGTDIACTVSDSPGTTEQAVGLIGFGQESGQCDHLMAIDLATGRQLWSQQLPDQLVGSSEGGLLAVAGGTAVVVSQDKALGLDLRTGATRWTGPTAGQSGCFTQQVAGAGQSLVELARCQSSFNVLSLDPATGKPAWTAHVIEPTDSIQMQVLAVDPVVVGDALTGPRGVARVQVFGPSGQVTSSMQVSGIPGAIGPIALDTSSHEVFGLRVMVADGLLVGVAPDYGHGFDIVAFRLASGQRQWLVHLPDEVNALRLSGNELMLVDESDPSPSLEEISLPDGQKRSLGFFSGHVYDRGEAGLYVAGGKDIIVNERGEKPTPPVAAITVPAR